MSVVHVVVGARPNLPKAAALFRAQRPGGPELQLVHTGQHTAPAMAEGFARELGLPTPHLTLAPPPRGPTNLAHLTREYGRAVAAAPPRATLVIGDVDSTLAATAAAVSHGVPVLHIEAGLRSAESAMREDANRRVVDRLATRLYTHSAPATRALLDEGRLPSEIVQVGNLLCDAILHARQRGASPEHPPEGPFALVTLHRPELVDHPDRLLDVLGGLTRLADAMPVVFAVHPRTADRLTRIDWQAPPGVQLLPPLLHSLFSWYLDEATLVVTDSGGVQEEASCLGTPCLTVRPDTERPVTLESGTNRVVGRSGAALVENALALLKAAAPTSSVIPGWDGHAAERLYEDLEQWLSRGR